MDDETRDNAGVIAPPPLIYATGFALGYGLHRLFPIRLLSVPWIKVLGGLLIAFSVMPGGWAMATMRRAHTRVEPWEATTSIVTSGPFRYTRNPIYLSFTLLYLGIAALVNSLTMLLPLPIVLTIMRRGVIEREERYLERKFGDEYTQYKRRVRRWL